MCMYCESFDHTWQKCPKKKEVKKTRKELHLKWSKQEPKQREVTYFNAPKTPIQTKPLNLKPTTPRSSATAVKSQVNIMKNHIPDPKKYPETR